MNQNHFHNQYFESCTYNLCHVIDVICWCTANQTKWINIISTINTRNHALTAYVMSLMSFVDAQQIKQNESKLFSQSTPGIMHLPPMSCHWCHLLVHAKSNKMNQYHFHNQYSALLPASWKSIVDSHQTKW